ncbi:MAG: tetratricopeptide repeat protein [Candidatus Accumulibacter sp.]|jgi:tetratricopeptide (TPR) repeat protein|nr:tetratricopeptide repeat protein [Accumulibacter sp.]
MSLLMEALKRAEESQQQQTPADAPTPKGATPESEARSSSAASVNSLTRPVSLSDNEFSNVSDDLSFAAGATQSKPAARDDAASERALVRKVFAAKQTHGPSLAFWITLAVLLAMASVASFHFWHQYKLITGSSQTHPLVPDTPGSTSFPPAPSIPPQASPFPMTPENAPSPPSPSPSSPAAASRSPSLSENPFAPEGVSAPPRRRGTTARGRATETPIHLSRGRSAVDPKLGSAYDLLRAGRFDEALPYYEAVLISDPENIDAVLGLAAIAGKSGQRERAAAYYRRALEIDPGNPTALAGSIDERGESDKSDKSNQSDPTASERTLRNALAARPDSPALLFSLGNLYAGQNRWSEARRAYFNAYVIDPGNADHAFNLAVSLDHLKQPRLAVRYYEAAVEAALENARACSFDVDQAKSRILELTSRPGAMNAR